MLKKHNWRRKMLAGVWVGIMMVAVLAACSGNTEKSSNPGESSAAPDGSSPPASVSAEPVKISIFTTTGSMRDITTNWFSKFVEEKFNIEFDWQVATSEAKEKQTLQLASNDYPDAYLGGNFNATEIQKYSKQGILVPLNDLIKQYAPNVDKALDETGLRASLTAPDGNIYGLPNYNYCKFCFFGAKLWINTKFLDDYGLQMPTTTEEFKHVLQVFKDNGLIPLTSSPDGWHSDPSLFLMNAFTTTNSGIGSDQSNYLNVTDGKIWTPVNTEEWRQGLAYMADLYKNKLMDNQTFSQSGDALTQLLRGGKVGVFADGASNNKMDTKDPLWAQFKTVPPLIGPNGHQSTAFFSPIPGNVTFVLTDKSTEEQRIALMKFLDYVWTSDGTQTLDYGEEGKYWKKADPGKLGADGKQALYTTFLEDFRPGGAEDSQNDGWYQTGPYYQSKEWREGDELTSVSEGGGLIANLYLETEKNYVGKQPDQIVPPMLWIDPANSDEYGLLRTNFVNYVSQSATEFITGSKSLDKHWDAYVSQLDKLGLQKFIDMTQAAMLAPVEASEFRKSEEYLKFLETMMQ